MAIRGDTQIKPGTVPASALAPNFNLPTAQLQQGADFLLRDGSVALTGDLNFGGRRGTGVAAPVLPSDIARLSDVEMARAGLSVKDPARVATTANINLTGLQLVDGIMVVAGDRVLVKNQTNSVQNGLYTAASGAWARATDADADAELREGTAVWITDGTAQGLTRWVISSDGPVTPGTTAQTWVQDNAASSVTAGDGMTRTGNTINVTATDGSIDVQPDSISVRLDGTSLVKGANGVKIADPGAGRVIMGNAAGQAVGQAITGDVALSPTGVATVSAGVRGKADWIAHEVLGNVPDGARTAFTLAFAPHAGIAMIHQNGLLCRPGTEYTITGQTVTFVTPPVAGDWLSAAYFKA